jgi:hypothetical protein
LLPARESRTEANRPSHRHRCNAEQAGMIPRERVPFSAIVERPPLILDRDLAQQR